MQLLIILIEGPNAYRNANRGWKKKLIIGYGLGR